MSRESGDQFKDGLLWNGYDYDQQAWVINGVYQNCGHPEAMRDCCRARDIAGLTVRALEGAEDVSKDELEASAEPLDRRISNKGAN